MEKIYVLLVLFITGAMGWLLAYIFYWNHNNYRSSVISLFTGRYKMTKLEKLSEVTSEIIDTIDESKLLLNNSGPDPCVVMQIKCPKFGVNNYDDVAGEKL